MNLAHAVVTVAPPSAPPAHAAAPIAPLLQPALLPAEPAPPAAAPLEVFALSVHAYVQFAEHQSAL